ncbi:anti-sigma factor family protein [Novosphingobium tardum]|uniref:Anti-sigma factor family protein n=1 Tax=Novosphingobium tardum TaxID=1538021 RepID=A0ABV8RJE9_9SPHN
MKPSREEIAAFADGELEGARRAEVAAAIEADPELAAQVGAHRALREQLSLHFAPFMEAPLPERLIRPLEQGDAVMELADARGRRDVRSSGSIARWAWLAAPALAASLALALFMPGRDRGRQVEGQLAVALDQQLVSGQAPDAPQRILLSFRNKAGKYCRAFTAQDQGGIACREAGGWRIEQGGEGVKPDRSEYRMARSSSAELLERAQAMAVGPALDAAQERRARDAAWR